VRILVLHQHYWPEEAATAQILSDLCEDLAKQGMEVTVVTGQPSYRIGKERRRNLPSLDSHEGVTIHRVWTYAPRRRSIWKRLLHYGSYFVTSLVHSLRQPRADVTLIMSTPPLLLGISAALMKVIRGVPFVYSVQDVYPDIARDLNVLRVSWLYKPLDTIARLLYQQANVVVTLSEPMRQLLLAKGVAKNSIKVIPNWADVQGVRPLSKDQSLRYEFGLSDYFVVLYSGNVGLSQALDSVIEAAPRVADLPVVFAIVGDGNALASLQDKVNAEGWSNVRFYPPQPRERLGALLALGDVGLVTMKKRVGASLVPSKLYGIMAASRPVLASVDADTEVSRVVHAHDCGWVTPAENPIALAEMIRSIYQTRDDLVSYGERGRAAVETFYSREICTEHYATVLKRVISAGSR
jgi:colanic acid biosynthesis glycosyl transferase WcaI